MFWVRDEDMNPMMYLDFVWKSIPHNNENNISHFRNIKKLSYEFPSTLQEKWRQLQDVVSQPQVNTDSPRPGLRDGCGRVYMGGRPGTRLLLRSVLVNVLGVLAFYFFLVFYDILEFTFSVHLGLVKLCIGFIFVFLLGMHLFW